MEREYYQNLDEDQIMKNFESFLDDLNHILNHDYSMEMKKEFKKLIP